MRAQALDAYRDAGLPTVKHEEWRYTPLTALNKHPWRLASAESGSRLRLVDIAHLLPAGTGTPRLVFVNGRLVPRLSSERVRGAHVMNLSRALESKGPSSRIVQAHLGRHAEIEGDALTALNTAFFEDGAFIHLERGQELKEPLQLLYLTIGSQTLSQSRHVVALDAASIAEIIEIHAGIGVEPRFSNDVCEIVVGEAASLNHTRVQLEDNGLIHVGMTRARVDRNGSLVSRVFTLGAALCRNNVHCVLNGEGSSATLSGLFLGRGRQHLDNHLYVEHATPLGTSRQFYRGVLDEKSRGVFSGKVVVRPGAQKTDAQQTNNNLLISDDAQIDTKPQLEIYADDVKCSHGATSGKLDDDALFFLRSRGLAEKDARALLTYAFCAELVDVLKPPSVREELARLVRARFQ